MGSFITLILILMHYKKDIKLFNFRINNATNFLITPNIIHFNYFKYTVFIIFYLVYDVYKKTLKYREESGNRDKNLHLCVFQSLRNNSSIQWIKICAL